MILTCTPPQNRPDITYSVTNIFISYMFLATGALYGMGRSILSIDEI
jgi:hypothetical protein